MAHPSSGCATVKFDHCGAMAVELPSARVRRVVSRIISAFVIVAAALVGGYMGGLASLLATHLITTEVLGMGEGAFLLMFVAFWLGVVIGASLFGLVAFWLMQAWPKDGSGPHRPRH